MGNSPLSNYYQTQVLLSTGVYAKVYKAQEKGPSGKSSKNWAMKKYDKNVEGWKNQADTVEQEVQTMRACHHKNIAKLKENFETKTDYYIIFEFCPDGELSDRINLKEGGLTDLEMASWLYQILRALRYLHKKNICHRNVKPETLVFSDKDTLKLQDFGVACFVKEGEVLTQSAGTDAFKAPELYDEATRKEVGYSFPVDMWAAGLTFHAMMTGHINGPFFDETKKEIDGDALREGMISSFARKQRGFGEVAKDAMQNVAEDAIQGAVSFFSHATTSQHTSDSLQPTSQALCMLMVEKDQKTRITAEDAMTQSWFQDVGLDVDTMSAYAQGDPPARWVTPEADESPPASNAKCCTIS